ncbi:RhoGAP-domain-containing protein [Microstroma glucosiphilum]|uniref:RhoGAP-domain-containing protein n=1 Tax=Pseudomicrostroma glucosiphilum TaxID=1684307 RepID=A0A316TZZ9_9BASI|nr:RhoGAP-domain-containing protein [Pseudomicrostroma glucosiphilum]PWN18667.1 RhoGAP-domain-containing protein [Pseudomicrostroma glucosiphilum]
MAALTSPSRESSPSQGGHGLRSSSFPLSSTSSGLPEASSLVDQRGGAASVSSSPLPLSTSHSNSSYLPAARSRLNSDLNQSVGSGSGLPEADTADSQISSSSRAALPTTGTMSRSTSGAISHPSSLYQPLSLSEVLSRNNGEVSQALEDALNDRNKFCQEAGKLSSENVRIWNLMGRIRKENEALKARLGAAGGDAARSPATGSQAGFLRTPSGSNNGWNGSSPSLKGRPRTGTNDSGEIPTPPPNGQRPSSSGSSSEAHHPPGMTSVPPSSSSRAASSLPPVPSSLQMGAGADSPSQAGISTIAPSFSRPATMDSLEKAQARTASARASPATATDGLEDQGEVAAAKRSSNSMMQEQAAAKAWQQSQQLARNTSSTDAGNGQREDVASPLTEDVFGSSGSTTARRLRNSLESQGEYTGIESSSVGGGNDSIVEGQSRISNSLKYGSSSNDTTNSVPLAASNSAQSQEPLPPLVSSQSTATPVRSIREIRSALSNTSITAAADSPSAWTDDSSATPIRSSRKDVGGMLGGTPSPSRPSIGKKASTFKLEPRDASTGSAFSFAKALAEVASNGPPGSVDLGRISSSSGPPQPRLNNALLRQVSVTVQGTNLRYNERAREMVSFFLLVQLDGPVAAGRLDKWMVEKLYSDVLGLDATLKHRHGKVALRNMVDCQLPDRSLFKDHAPSKVDLRKAILEAYFDTLLAINLPDKDDICTFLCTDFVPVPIKDPSAMTKEGLLTKKGQNLGRWVTRLYSLENGERLDYLEGKGGPLLGSIDLRGAQIGKQQKNQSSESDENSYRHAFLILERKERINGTNGLDAVGGQPQLIRHVLCAESDEERDEWVDILVRAIDHSDKERKGQVGSASSPNDSPSGPDSQPQAVPAVLPTSPAPAPTSSHTQAPMMATTDSVSSNLSAQPDRQRRAPDNAAQMQPSPSGDMSATAEPTSVPPAAAPALVPAVLPNRPSRSGSLSRRFRARENSGSGGMLAVAGGEEPSRRSRDGGFGRRGSAAAPSTDSSSTHPGLASPNAKDRGSKLPISGPVSGAPIPAGYKFGNREDTTADSAAAGRRDDRRRFWHRFGNSASNSSTGAAGQPRPPVFGVPLLQAISVSPINAGEASDTAIPSVVYRCIDFLESKGGIREEGIYRLSGSSTAVKGLRDRFDTEGDVDLVKEVEDGEKGSVRDPHAVAGLLKTYLRELPSSILTKEMHMDFLRVCDVVDRTQRTQELASLVSSLPRPNYSLLRALIQHLIKVTNHEDVNKMTVRNVGIVFSPTLGIPAGLFGLFITTFEQCFGIDGADEASTAAVLGSQTIGAAPIVDEEANEGVKHSQVSQTEEEESGVNSLDSSLVNQSGNAIAFPSTSRSSKRESRLFSAADMNKFSSSQTGSASAAGTGMFMPSYAEEEDAEEAGNGAQPQAYTSPQPQAYGSRNSSRRPSAQGLGIENLPRSHARTMSASGLVAGNSTAEGNAMGSGIGSGNGNGVGPQAPLGLDEPPRYDQRDEDELTGPGLPTVTTSRISAGGESAANVLRTHRV